MKTMTQKLDFNKSTKGTHQFTTDDKDCVTSSIYIKKDAMPVAPEYVVITVEYDDE